ncbi:MAG: polymer-forming cytoskeletal protein [bacterium]|nr:polymer-forming cytoskeletal protein [bacterium]
MSIFNDKQSLPTNGGREIETVIGPSVKVEGNFRGQGNVIVEGVVHGSLKTDKDLTVGAGAKISASVIAANAKISGEVRGTVKIKGKLELTETARIFGDIETETLSVAPGAILNGKCTMVKEPPTPELFGPAGAGAKPKILEKKK